MKVLPFFRFAIVLCGVASTSLGHATSPFDGRWKGEGQSTAQCSDKAVVVFTIKDGEIVQFSLVGPRGQTANGKGKIKDDGTATFEYGGRLQLQGNLLFKGNLFEGKLDTLCGLRDFNGTREP